MVKKEPQKVEIAQTPTPPKPKSLNFGEAVGAMMAGKKVRRQEWPADEYCFLNENYLTIFRNGQIHRWIVSAGDIQGIDWVELK